FKTIETAKASSNLEEWHWNLILNLDFRSLLVLLSENLPQILQNDKNYLQIHPNENLKRLQSQKSNFIYQIDQNQLTEPMQTMQDSQLDQRLINIKAIPKELCPRHPYNLTSLEKIVPKLTTAGSLLTAAKQIHLSMQFQHTGNIASHTPKPQIISRGTGQQPADSPMVYKDFGSPTTIAIVLWFSQGSHQLLRKLQMNTVGGDAIIAGFALNQSKG
ncbi:hypothetical protein CR513_43504, partial [Mucuna pruriens]